MKQENRGIRAAYLTWGIGFLLLAIVCIPSGLAQGAGWLVGTAIIGLAGCIVGSKVDERHGSSSTR